MPNKISPGLLYLCTVSALLFGLSGLPVLGAGDTEGLLGKAQGYFIEHRFDDALHCLERLVAIEPANAQARNLLGKVYHRLNNLELAEANYRKAAQLAPTVPEPRYNLAMLLFDKGDTDQACQLMKQVCSEGANPEYLHDLGVIFEKQGNLADANAAFAAAAKMVPNNSEYHYALARSLYLNQHVNSAIPEYQKAISLNPNNIDAHNNLGVAYNDLGRFSEAIDEFQTSLKINSNYPEAQQNLGYAQAHTSLGITYFKQGNTEKALDEYRKALNIDPNFADAFYNLGLLYQKQGNLDNAMQAYQSAIHCDPTNAKAHNNLGAAYLQAGKRELAIAEFSTALKIKPNFAEAKHNLDDLRSP